MTTDQILDFVGIASNEALREIVAGGSDKWKWCRFYARRELARRDHIETFGH
jgi:hypothetical protein